MRINTYLIIVSFLIVFTQGCAVKKSKNIEYLSSSSTIENPPTLNVFSKRTTKNTLKKPVLIFVHGGNWNSGDKSMYGFLGRNFVKHDIVTVIPGYTLSPQANYDVMAQQIAHAITWTLKNIETYGGDPDKIFLTGHSAGGHLISLATLNPKYGIDTKNIKGIILNDAAALDMKNYLEQKPPTTSNNYTTTWTKDPKNWKDASPIYFLSENAPPFKIYLGTKTYNSIKVANDRFLQELHKFQPQVTPILLKKKHIPMITQYFWPWSNRYDEIKNFITTQ